MTCIVFVDVVKHITLRYHLIASQTWIKTSIDIHSWNIKVVDNLHASNWRLFINHSKLNLIELL